MAKMVKLVIRKGTVAFHLEAPVGLFAISPMKNRRMPLPSRLRAEAYADEPGFLCISFKNENRSTVLAT